MLNQELINMSSGVGKGAMPSFGAYAASKLGVIGFAQSVALELTTNHINVNAMCLGTVDTKRVSYIEAVLSSEEISPEMWRVSAHRKAFLNHRASNIPLGRSVDGKDIAKTAVFLESAQSDDLTGLAINVAGGDLMD